MKNNMEYHQLVKEALSLKADIEEIKREALQPIETKLAQVEAELMQLLLKQNLKKVDVDGVGSASLVIRQTKKLNENKLSEDLSTINKNLEDYRYISGTSEFIKLSECKPLTD